MKTATDLYNEAKARVREIDAKEALKLHAEGRATFVDVRDLNEVNLGMIPGAIHLDRGRLESKVEAAIPRDAVVVLYCAAAAGAIARASRDSYSASVSACIRSSE